MKKSKGGWRALNRSICAVNSVAVGLLEEEGHVLESGGRDPLAVLRCDQRLVRRHPEYFRIALGGDAESPDVHRDDRDAILVRDVHLGEENRAVEFASDT